MLRRRSGATSCYLEHVLPEHRNEVDASFKTALTNNTVWNIETRIRRKDGAVRWIAIQGKISAVEAGKPLTMIGINMDITARKQAELALQEREQQLRAILDVLPVAVFMCDADRQTHPGKSGCEPDLGSRRAAGRTSASP